jgi:transposase-like protein
VGVVEAIIVEQGAKMQEKETLDEKLPGLFEPDTLLPIQYFEAMRRKHLLEGEKRLILSVLEDAVECFMKCIDSPSNKGQRLFREADEWIFLEDKRWVFSFDNVAEMLDINPEYMRRGLRQWKERKLADLERQATMKLEAEAVAPVAETVEASVEAPKPIEALKPQFATAEAGPAKVFRPRTSRRKKATIPAPSRSGRNMRKAHA